MARRMGYLPVCALCAPFVCLLLGGCGGGGGGGGGASAPTASVQELTVSPQGEEAFGIACYVTVVPEPVRLTLEYSEDRGVTFHASAAVTGQTVLAQGADRGALVWRAIDDLGSASQGDVVVRVTPFGAQTGTQGTPAVSTPFAYRENSAPEVTAVAPTASPAGSPVTISVTGRDAEGDAVLLAASYSLDGGGTYTAIDTWGPIAFPAGGTVAQFQWGARDSLGEGEFPQVRIKVVAQDAAAQDERVSSSFRIITYRPRVTGITVEGIPLTMNGSTPFTNTSNQLQTYRLLVPASGFTLQVYYEAHEDGGAIDPTSLSFTAGRPIGPSGELAAGTDLGARFTAGAQEAALAVGPDLLLPAGALTVTATIADELGNTAEDCNYTFTVETAGEAFRPFQRQDAWGLVFTRDYWTVAATCPNGTTVTVTPTFGANGTADFIDDLTLLGLYNASYADLSARVAALVKERVLANLRSFYSRPADGVLDAADVPIVFTLSTGSATSTIAMGGADPAGGYTLGRAYFDRGNSRYDQNVSASLGIFATNLIRFYINTSFTFKNLFDEFIPGRGQPIGTAPEDAQVLSDAFVPDAPGNTQAQENRYTAIQQAADGFGRALAAIAAHEIGHSVGLVANGAPSTGLFGGERNAEFAGSFTDSYHLDTPGNNVMESSMSFTVTQYTGTRTLKFNPMNIAYLLQRILVKR